MGTPHFAIPSLEMLLQHPQIDIVGVITQPDKPAGRTGTPQFSPVKQFAFDHNLTIWTPEKVKHNDELINQIKTSKPDTIVVAAYGKILPQEILDIPPKGIVNIHGSFLPKYRGASPIAASIINGDTIARVTLMKMALAMDAGPIIATSEPVAIEPSDTTGTLTQKLSQAGAELLQQQLIPYLENKISPLPQDEQNATTVSLVKKEDGKINWQESATLIERKIRAYQPWPSAYTFWQGQRIKLMASEVIPEAPSEVGTIWLTPDHYPAVTTGEDSLKIITLQLEGKAVTSGKDFLLGRPNLIGSQLE